MFLLTSLRKFFSWKLVLLFCQFLKITVSHGYASLHTNNSDIQEYIDERSGILDRILVGYDRRFIPSKLEYPLKVEVQIVISDVFNLDDSNMELQMLLYIRQIWFDYRLAWNATDFSRIKVREHFLDKIWIPDIRITNLKDMKRFHEFGGTNMNIHSNGRIYFSQLALVTISCPMDLHKFPMDKQTCFLNFSSYAYPKSLMQFSLTEKKTVVKAIRLPQFNFIKTERVVHDGDPNKVPRFSISVTFERRSGYYIIQIYVPSLFIVLLSWLSFFMESTDIGNRLALEVTMILSIVFLLGSSNNALPHLSYAKASDLFIIVSFGFIFLALLQTMLTYHLASKQPCSDTSTCSALIHLKKDVWLFSPIFKRNKKAKPESEIIENDNEKDESSSCIDTANTNVAFEPASGEESVEISRFWLDKICLVAFPTLYIVFNIAYWSHYL